MRQMLEALLASDLKGDRTVLAENDQRRVMELIKLAGLLEEEIEKIRPLAELNDLRWRVWRDFHEAVDELVYARQPGG